ncbi:MAG TPA: hypothetical protein VFG76_08585 [Candidatus Polarisedimenticolia bacterium]|nr:hypothetical protein [Candidatus Polarisedimenticolia bacterium]
MKRVLPLVTAGLLLAGGAAGFAVTGGGQQVPNRRELIAPTIGEFVLQYARTARLVGSDATADQALEALRATGMIGREPVALSAPLTERDVVQLTRNLKLGLATQSPDRRFSREQADTFFSVFGSVLAGGKGGKIHGEGILAGTASTSGSGGQDANDDDDDHGDDDFNNGADPRTKGKGKKKGLSPDDPD